MYMDFTKTGRLQHNCYKDVFLLHRVPGFVVVKVINCYRPKSQRALFENGTNRMLSWANPGYYLIQLDKRPWDHAARNPFTNKLWRYLGHGVTHAKINKNWRKTEKLLTEICDNLSELRKVSNRGKS